MPAEGNRLYPHEALELRAQYDARIKTLSDCLPLKRHRIPPHVPAPNLTLKLPPKTRMTTWT